mmetsp:Transcript_136643/g.436633  ORF Transcript_136643/g.436633 Transcript_136643/m.436633 type:complete len:222 (-) Transcript_136643:48-713(-)
MGKYQKKQQVQKIKSTVGAGNKQKKTKKGKGKAHKKSIAAKIAAAKQKKEGRSCRRCRHYWRCFHGCRRVHSCIYRRQVGSCQGRELLDASQDRGQGHGCVEKGAECRPQSRGIGCALDPLRRPRPRRRGPAASRAKCTDEPAGPHSGTGQDKPAAARCEPRPRQRSQIVGTGRSRQNWGPGGVAGLGKVGCRLRRGEESHPGCLEVSRQAWTDSPSTSYP